MAQRYTVSELVIGVKADIREMRIGLQEGISELRNFSADVGDMGQRINTLAKGIGVYAAASLGMVGVAAKLYSDLQQTIANTASVTGSTAEEMKDLENYARKMGRETVFTATQVGEAMYFLASAGYNAAQIFDSLQPIIALAAGTQYDLAEASAVVVTTLNQFGMQASEAYRVANALAASVAYSQAEMYKLAVSLRYIGPSAANLNYSIEETVGALSLLYDAGLEASMAGTGLRMSLARLQAPTAQMFKAFDQLGLKWEEINPVFNNFVDIVRRFEEAGAGSAKAGKALNEIFDIRAANAMKIFIRTGADSLQSMINRITDTNKAMVMQQQQLNTLKGYWKLMSGTIQDVGFTFGDTLAPVLMMVMTAVRNVALAFLALPDSVKSTVVVVSTLIPTLALVTTTIAALIGLLPKLITMFKTASAFFTIFGGAVAWVTMILGALTAGILYLVSAYGAENRARKEMLSEYSNLLDRRDNELQKTIYLTETVRELSKATKENVVQYNKLQRSINQLNELYPGLINKNQSLESQMDKIVEVSEEASKALDEVRKSKERLASLQYYEKVLGLQKEVADLKKELTGLNLAEIFRTQFSDIKRQGVKLSKESTEQFKKDLIGVNAELFNVVKSDMLYYTGFSNRALVNMSTLKTYTENLAQSEEGRNKLMNMYTNLGDRIINNQIEYYDLLNKSKDPMYDMTEEEKSKLKAIEGSIAGERVVHRILSETVKVVTDIADKEEQIAALRRQQKEIGKTREKDVREKGSDEFIIEEKRRAQQLESFLYDMEIAGTVNRMREREIQAKKWYAEALFRAKELGADTAAVDAAYEVKKAEVARKNSQDLWNFNKALSLQGERDVLKIGLMELEEKKRRAIENAIALGESTAEIEKKYEIQIGQFRLEHQMEVNKANRDLYLQLMDSRTSAMIDGMDKEIAEENARYQRSLGNVREFLSEQLKLVKEGKLREYDVYTVFTEMMNNAMKEHNNRMIVLKEEHAAKNAAIDADIAAKNVESNAILAASYTSLREMELSEEDSAYEERKKNLDKWHTDSLNSSRGQAERLLAINEAYQTALDALEVEHNAKKAGIDSEFFMAQAQLELDNIDRKTSLYDEALENYRTNLEEQLLLVKGDADSQRRILEELDNVDKIMAKRKIDRAREWSTSVSKIISNNMNQVGVAIFNTAKGATGAWREASKAMIKLAADEARTWLELQMLKAVAAHQWWKVAGIAAGIAAVGAAEAYGYERVEATAADGGERKKKGGTAKIVTRRTENNLMPLGGAVGASVKRSGLAIVHEGEDIVPSFINNALIRRKNWSQYLAELVEQDSIFISSLKKSANTGITKKSPEQKISIDFRMNVNTEGAVIYPAGSDAQQEFVERVIQPVEKRLRKTMESIIQSRGE